MFIKNNCKIPVENDDVSDYVKETDQVCSISSIIIKMEEEKNSIDHIDEIFDIFQDNSDIVDEKILEDDCKHSKDKKNNRVVIIDYIVDLDEEKNKKVRKEHEQKVDIVVYVLGIVYTIEEI